MTAAAIAVVVAGAAMIAYAVLGGADFGGGVWNFFATGPRAADQREAIAAAIGPVWEAHHIWLIYLIVLSFTCFPAAYADATVGLYLPMSIALLGIVFRGVAFVFRTFATGAPRTVMVLSVTFGAASLITPFAFGDCLGALATGTYAIGSPFALAVGVFAVAVCAQTAAAFILLEVRGHALRADFRHRAFRSTVAVWVTGVAPLLLSTHALRANGPLDVAVAGAGVLVAAVAGVAVLVFLRTNRDDLVRGAVVVQTAAIFVGWYLTQAPQLIPGRFTYAQAAASPAMIVAFLYATLGGLVVLVPSLLFSYAIFKSRRALQLAPPSEVV